MPRGFTGFVRGSQLSSSTLSRSASLRCSQTLSTLLSVRRRQRQTLTLRGSASESSLQQPRSRRNRRCGFQMHHLRGSSSSSGEHLFILSPTHPSQFSRCLALFHLVRGHLSSSLRRRRVSFASSVALQGTTPPGAPMIRQLSFLHPHLALHRPPRW